MVYADYRCVSGRHNVGKPLNLQARLALSYGALIAYASLYPLTGWRDSGVALFDFLHAGWPRYFTGFDLATNILGYLPLSLFIYAALQSRKESAVEPPTRAWLIACATGMLMSLSLETMQNFLPSRVPSNLDLACNTTGAIAGASLGRWLQPRTLEEGHLAHWHQRHFAVGANNGLALLALWLLTQLDPGTLLFGAGDVRRLIGLPAAQNFSPDGFRAIEATIVATTALAVGLLAGQLQRRRRFRFVALTLAFGLAIKSLSLALLMGATSAFAWATEGNLVGLLIGLLILWVARRLVLPLQSALAALSLLVATVMVNLSPDNPYLDQMQQVWNPGQFLNFHGLTQFTASLWPFLALPWLMVYRPERINL